MRRRLPDILAVMSLPVGLAAYLLTGAFLAVIGPGLATNIVGLFVPLFVAGLAMIPFIAPWFDRRAKADLAKIRAEREREAEPPEG